MDAKHLGILGLGALAMLVSLGEPIEERAPSGEIRRLELCALDYRLDVFDLRGGKLGFSKQFDQDLRLYYGDLLFSGERFSIIENERQTGSIVDLGATQLPDSEFGLFHGLRLWKRNLQVREFPFEGRYKPLEGFDSTAFFSENQNPSTSAQVALGHVYLVRLFQRTRLADERVFLLKVIEFQPGVKLVALWRELEDEGRG